MDVDGPDAALYDNTPAPDSGPKQPKAIYDNLLPSAKRLRQDYTAAESDNPGASTPAACLIAGLPWWITERSVAKLVCDIVKEEPTAVRFYEAPCNGRSRGVAYVQWRVKRFADAIAHSLHKVEDNYGVYPVEVEVLQSAAVAQFTNVGALPDANIEWPEDGKVTLRGRKQPQPQAPPAANPAGSGMAAGGALDVAALLASMTQQTGLLSPEQFASVQQRQRGTAALGGGVAALPPLSRDDFNTAKLLQQLGLAPL
eukprot:TRINITY_DN24853_c0_g1_i1.p1 TRINITY_DN24853_c0_g1~~TRINITY_DN24853_c0_g1_i1.p1  ORF type:complete len:256 (+),score=57.55 TRINITY_DN24853_c0_g1_i1:81-848(+)